MLRSSLTGAGPPEGCDRMRSGGFPCRYGGCDVRFAVTEQGSMNSLLAASAERSAHELAVHAYTHVRLDDITKKPSWALRRTVAPKP
ncbi:MAG TPA: hypothetical protein VIN37_08200 [Candidatus Limnocylindria bacterium]